jgi:hypothetical protein
MDQIHQVSCSRRAVILAKPQESSFWRSQNLRICLCCAAAPSGEPMQATPNQPLANNSHQINLLPGATRSKSLYFTHNPYFLNLLSATSVQ